LVHYVMLVFNPNSNTCFYIDPKGLHLESSQLHTDDSWEQEYRNIYTLFENCHWINVITSDLQSLSSNDNFCQTWSLMITLYLACDRVDIDSVTQYFSSRPLNRICSFLKECIQHKANASNFGTYFYIRDKKINPAQ